MSYGKMGKAAFRWNKIQKALKTHDDIMNGHIRELCGLSTTTANRILAGLITKREID